MRLSGQRQSFLRNNFEHTKAQFKQKSTNKTKRSEHKQQKKQFFARAKSSKRMKIVCFAFCCFLGV